MSKVNYGRMVKSLSTLSNEQLPLYSQEVSREMQRRGISDKGNYVQGFSDGFKEGRRVEKAIEPIRKVVNQINIYANMMSAIAVAGTGKLREDLIHDLSGELGRLLVQVNQLLERAIVKDKLPFLRGSIDFTPIHDFLKGATHFFATGDASLLFLPPDDSPLEIITEIERGRSTYLPGADRDPVIDRLCEKARPYKMQFMSDEKVLNQLMLDLQNPQNDDERAELEQLDGWGKDAFSKAFKKRNPKRK